MGLANLFENKRVEVESRVAIGLSLRAAAGSLISRNPHPKSHQYT